MSFATESARELYAYILIRQDIIVCGTLIYAAGVISSNSQDRKFVEIFVAGAILGGFYGIGRKYLARY